MEKSSPAFFLEYSLFVYIYFDKKGKCGYYIEVNSNYFGTYKKYLG